MRAAVLLLVIVGAPLSARAQADLPNANLPGNSPTLPNSNLPGSLPTDNPISLPSSDTTPSVVQFWSPYVFPLGSNLPVRNPTVPPTPDELVAIDVETRRRLNDADLAARAIRDSAAARENAAAVRENVAAVRENAAAAREDSAAAREDVAATVEQQAAAAAPPAEAPPASP